MHALFDYLAQADAAEFYNLVVAEIQGREFPDVEFGWREETESTKLLRSGEKANALKISFRGDVMIVLALRIGKSLVVSTRRLIASNRDKAGILHEVLVAAFEETVKRSVRDALKHLLERKNLGIPDDLRPENVFFTPFEE